MGLDQRGQPDRRSWWPRRVSGAWWPAPRRPPRRRPAGAHRPGAAPSWPAEYFADAPTAAHAVAPADLLALGVRATGVGDADLEDAAAQCRRPWPSAPGSTPKRSSSMLDLLEHLAAEDLVAGLHVGQVQVGEHVRQRGQQPVADAVPEVQDAVGVGASRSASRRPRRPGRRGSAASSRSSSAGSYSRSASWTTTNGAVARRSPCAAPRPCPGSARGARLRSRGSDSAASTSRRAVGGAVVDDDQLGHEGKVEHAFDAGRPWRASL